MRRDAGDPPLPTIPDPDLTAHALGRLDPADRERVERALRDDEAVRARYETIAAHLGRYDALEAPPPPPFAALAARLPDQRRRATRVVVRLAWAGAAAAVVLLALGLWWGRDDAELPARLGEGLVVTEGGAWTAPDEPAEAWLGERVHLVLDAGTRLVPLATDRVRLAAGRAFFEVRPGPDPFDVVTACGVVGVRGTAFEVAVEGEALFVAVSEGAVEAAGHRVGVDRALVDGVVVAAPHEAGAFFRRPTLALTVDEAPASGEAVTLAFTFANPGRVPFALAGPDGVRAPLWVEIVSPSGEVHDVAVPAVDAPDGPLPAGRPLHLAARSERSFAARLALPSRDRGAYRCRALYRPEGQPSLVSEAVLLEVR